MDNKKVNAVRIHKNFLRKLIRSDNLHPNKKMMAELILSYLEEILPLPLLESLLLEQYGTTTKLPKEGEVEVIPNDLKKEWLAVLEENTHGVDSQHPPSGK
jgi:hypothetical protein